MSHYGTSQCVPWVAISCCYLFLFSPLSVCHKRNSFLDMVPLLLSVFPQSYNLWDLICRLKSLYLEPFSLMLCLAGILITTMRILTNTRTMQHVLCHFLNGMCASSQPSHLWTAMPYSEVSNLSIKEENILYYLILWSLTWHQCSLLIPSSSN